MPTKPKPSELAVGDEAPRFEAVDEGGQLHKLEDYTGRTLVLYFYPKDMTSGCTKEACDFRDYFNKFAKKGIFVLGVSPDTVESHVRFQQKLLLPFPLLADPEKKMCEAFGVWREKAMYGRRFKGIERSTFVIGPDGVFTQVHRKVALPGHAEAVFKGL